MSSIRLLCRAQCKAAVEAPAGQSETLLRQTPLGLLGTSLTSGLSEWSHCRRSAAGTTARNVVRKVYGAPGPPRTTSQQKAC